MTTRSAAENAGLIVDEVLKLPPAQHRRLIAIAGPPAVGKSTVAELVCARLSALGHPTGLVPMDGFHLDNDTLRAKDLLERKGAPETFDLASFTDLIERLKAEPEVLVPLFDRERDCTLPDAHQISAEQTWVVVEGNYLLLDLPEWRNLAAHWDLAMFIENDFAELERRLIKRWLDHGLQKDDATQRAHKNDIPNAKLVMSKRLPSIVLLPDQGAGLRHRVA